MKVDLQGLKSMLLNEVGLSVTAFEPVATRSHSPNFKTTTADGRTLLVKLASPKAHLARVGHPLAVHDLHPERELLFAGRRVYVLEWRNGKSKTLDRLGDGELHDLMDVYAGFRSALGTGRIHGDFNCNNVLFEGGRVSGVLDLEAVRDGHPCEDWVRFALTGAERLPVFAWRRRRRLAENLARIAEGTDFASADWARAIDGFAAAKRARKLRSGRLSPFARANLWWRSRFHRFCLQLIMRGGKDG